jgi:hypothetical protein
LFGAITIVPPEVPGNTVLVLSARWFWETSYLSNTTACTQLLRTTACAQLPAHNSVLATLFN